MVRRKVRAVASCLVFLFLAYRCFLFCTYLFRNTRENTRQNLVQLYVQDRDSIDVALIGASSVYEFWNTMEAWDKYGIASYDYSTAGFCAEATIPAIREILKTQSPKLVVVEVRKLLMRFRTTEIDLTVRNVLDSIDYSINRLRGYQYFCDVHGIPYQDSLSGYIDLMEYHDNYEALAVRANWELSDNRPNSNMEDAWHYYGYALRGDRHDFTEPEAASMDGKAELPDTSVRVLADIIDFCQEKDIPLLLAASPFSVLPEDQMEINSLRAAAEERGVPFLDTNKYYREMGLDFHTDYYDQVHVNVNGAVKFTDFLAKYITGNYGIPDHRGDDRYASWEDSFGHYRETKKKCEENVRVQIASQQAADDKSNRMRSSTDAAEWLSMAKDKEFTVFSACMEPLAGLSDLEGALLGDYGISREGKSGNQGCIGVYNRGLLYCSDDNAAPYSGGVGYEQEEYTFCLEPYPKLQIKDSVYAYPSANLWFLAYNNSRSEVFDAVAFEPDGAGGLRARHLYIGQRKE